MPPSKKKSLLETCLFFSPLQDVVAISARPYGQRAVLKFAQYTGCLSIAGRFTPGTFTNQITKQFREPRLLIITDPRPDAQVPEPSLLASKLGRCGTIVFRIAIYEEDFLPWKTKRGSRAS